MSFFTLSSYETNYFRYIKHYLPNALLCYVQTLFLFLEIISRRGSKHNCYYFFHTMLNAPYHIPSWSHDNSLYQHGTPTPHYLCRRATWRQPWVYSRITPVHQFQPHSSHDRNLTRQRSKYIPITPPTLQETCPTHPHPPSGMRRNSWQEGSCFITRYQSSFLWGGIFYSSYPF